MKKRLFFEIITILSVIFLIAGCIFTRFYPPSLVYLRPGNGAVDVALNALLEWKFEPGAVKGFGDTPTIVSVTLEFGPQDDMKKINDFYFGQGTYDPDLNYGQTYEWQVTAEDSNGKTSTINYSFTVEATPLVVEELALSLDATDIYYLVDADETQWWSPPLVTVTVEGTNVTDFDLLTYCTTADHAYELSDIAFPLGENATTLTCQFNIEKWMLPDADGNITIGNNPAPGTTIIFTIEAQTETGTIARETYRVTGLNATATLNATQAETTSTLRGNEINLENIGDNKIELTFNTDFNPDIFQAYGVNIQLIEAPVGPTATPSVIVEANDKSKSVKDHLYTLNNGGGVYVFKGTLQGTTTCGQYIAEIISDFATVNYNTDATDPDVDAIVQGPQNNQATITFTATDTDSGFDPTEQMIEVVNEAHINWNTPPFNFVQGTNHYTYTVECAMTPDSFDGETKRATLTAKDMAGNVTLCEATFSIDNMAPRIEPDPTNPATTIQTGQTKTFRYDITDGGGLNAVSISFNNANHVVTNSFRGKRATTQTASITLTGTETGTGTITVIATDTNDNVTVEHYSIIVYEPLNVAIKNVATDNGNCFTGDYATVTFTATGTEFVEGFYRITVGGESTFSNINRMEDQDVVWRLPTVDGGQFWATIVATDTHGAAYSESTQAWVDNTFGALSITSNSQINADSFNSPALFATITVTDYATIDAIEITNIEGIDSSSATISPMITPLVVQRNNHTKMATASLIEPFGTPTTYATVTFTATDTFGNSTDTDVILGIDTDVPTLVISFEQDDTIMVIAGDLYVDENLGGFVSKDSIVVELTHQSSFTDSSIFFYLPHTNPMMTLIFYGASPTEAMNELIYATVTVTDKSGNVASQSASGTINTN